MAPAWELVGVVPRGHLIEQAVRALCPDADLGPDTRLRLFVAGEDLQLRRERLERIGGEYLWVAEAAGFTLRFRDMANLLTIAARENPERADLAALSRRAQRLVALAATNAGGA